MKIGIIGCGNISSAYLRLAPQFKGLDIVACSDIDESAAVAQAAAFGCKAVPIDAMLADQAVEAVINLTVPSAHMTVSASILKAGKHVYSEKPFVLSYEEGLQLHQLAIEQGKRIGSAPDTFLGGAHQQARAIIDSGELGRITGGTCFFMNPGMEGWHPNPDFFYQPGGGPMLDMGPYYISNLVQFLGPVRRLMSMTAMPASTRTIGSEPRAGETVPVNTPTSVSSLLEFHNGAQISVNLSWDVQKHEHNCMELYGSKATLYVPDPNFFGGEVRVATAEEQRIAEDDHPLSVLNDQQDNGDLRANYRGVGLADMVAAIRDDREHRCNDSLALHVVDIMTSALRSGESGQAVQLQSSCNRPAALSREAALSLLR
jgi:predicted dehydrogenase